MSDGVFRGNLTKLEMLKKDFQQKQNSQQTQNSKMNIL